MSPISNFMKIHPVGARQMERPDEGNRHISQFLLTCQKKLKFTFDDQ